MPDVGGDQEKWWLPFCPIDLGLDHWVGWQENGNLWFLHPCLINGQKKPQLGWIDLVSGEHHRLISKEPLHIEASVACPGGCGDHGWIRGGKWEMA